MKHLDNKKTTAFSLLPKPPGLIYVLLAFFIMCFSGTVSALTYNVTSTTDFAYTAINNSTGVITAGAGVGQVTLRSAIQAADATGGTHTINVPAGTYNLVRGSIIFGNGAQNITISGAGAATTVISMTTTQQDRIFFINPPGTVANVLTTLTGLRFTGGRLTSDIYGGGAILAGGPSNALTINNCTFDNNTIAATAGTTGGAINMSGGGALTIDQCTFSNNSNPVSDGGAVYYFLQNFANLTGSMTITNSVFTNNTVTATGSNGGAVGFAAQGATTGQSFSVSIQRNTFTGNSAPSGTGGAIHANNSFGATGVVNILYNRIVGNTASNVSTSGLAMASAAGSVAATNNWWGCNNGPTVAGCNRAAIVGSGGAGTLNVSTWLQLRHTASPNSICPTAFGPGNTSTLTASFLTNSAGTAIPTANLTTLIGLPITFNNPVLGTISGAQSTIQPDGTATATFTSNGTAGNASANAVFVPLVENTVVTSSTITVNSPPAIGTQPADVTLCGSGSATFSVMATGAGLSYQWQSNDGSGFVDAAGASTGASYTVNPATSAMSGYTYRVVVSGLCGVLTSNAATLTVNEPPVVTAPAITQPTCSTPTATVVVNATGAGTLEYSVNNGTNFQTSATFTGIAPSTNINIRVRLQAHPTCFTNYTGNPVAINAVPAAPAVNNPVTTTGTVGTAFSQTFTTTGGLAPITFSTTSTLPTGLTLSASGVLSGTPTQPGTFPIVVQATDANGCTGTGASYNLMINCQTITVTNPGVTTGTVGIAFSQTFTQTGGNGAIIFSTTSTLPTGLTLSAAGVLSGTPTQFGTFPIVVRVTDANGCFVDGATYTLIVSCQTITVTNPAITTGQLNIPFNQTFTQTGGNGAITFSTTSTLPTGLTLSASGVLSGMPTQTGTFPIVVRATDANGCFGDGTTYTLVIIACPITDQTVTASPVSVCSGAASTITVGASDPGVSYTLRNSAGNVFVDGPVVGTGAPVNFSTGNISVNTTYNVLAETDKYSVYLNGSQSGFAIPQASALNVTDNFTIEGWIKPDGNSGFARLFNKDGSYALGISANQTQLTFTRHNAGDFSRPFNFVNGNWYHIASTYSGGTVELFVNGTSIGMVTGVPAIDVTASGGHIGSDASGNFNRFKGNLDNVRVWSSVRTQAQISANQSAYLTSTGNPTLVASWWITEGSGNARDYSANAINATALSGTWQLDAPVPSCSIVLSGTPTVTITPDNTITLSSAPGTNTQTVCIDAPITDITYTTTTATGATFSGLPPGVTGSWTNNVVTISGSPATATGSPFNYTVTLTGGCGTATANGSITVNPVPTVNAVANQNVCNDEVTAPVNFSGPVSGTVYSWINNTPSIGLAASGTGDILPFTAINTTNTVITATIIVTPSYTANGLTCTGNPVTFTITVNPEPIADLVENQTVCNGAPTSPVNFSGPVSGTVYSWINNTPSIGLAASGTGDIPSFNGVNTTNAPVVATITVTPSISGGSSECLGTPVSFTITVNPDPTINPVSDQVVCNSSNTTAINFGSPSTGGTIIYNWVNSAPSIGLAAAGSGNIPSFTALNTSSIPVIATVTVIASYTNGGLTCTGSPITFTITVNPTPNAVATPASQTICSGSAITTIALSGAVAGTTYAWTRDNTATVTGIAASGSGDISGSLINTTSAPVTITFTITPSANGCPGTAITATVTVNPTPVAVATPASQTICSGSAITTIALSGAVAGTTYTWTRDNTASVTGITASGSGDISGSLTNTTTAPVTVTFTITPTANGCTGTPVTATVTVNPTPDAVATPASQTICSGNAITTIALSGAVAGTTYTWTRDNTATVTGIAASGSGDISGSLTNTTSAPVTVTFTITPSANGCPGTAITATVTVNPTPVAVATPATQTICSGSAITTIALSGAVAGTTYTWTRDNTAIVTGIAASGSGDISGSLTNTTTAPVTVTFTITPTANGCTGTPVTATVVVNPTPDAVATPALQTICSGNAITTIALTGNVAGTSFSWTRDNTASVTGIAASGSGDISGSLVNTTSAPVTVTFTITPSANGCTGDPITATVLVNPTPTAVATPASQTICSGNAIMTIALSGPVSGTTYTWTRNNTASVTGIAASGSGNISGTLTNTTSSPVTVTFTITPTANGCSGTPVTATVLVNPTPNAVATPATQSICTGSAITTIVLSGGVSGTTYTWTRDNTASVTGIPASGSGNISGSLTNTTSAPVTVTFTITPTANGCTGVSVTATVVVNPVPNAVATPASQTICSGDAITTIVLSGVVSGTAYTWTRNNTASVTGIPAAGSGNISGWLTNNTSSPVTVTFTITPSANGCTGTPVTATVLVNPSPQGTISIDPNPACVGSTVSLSASGGISYAWSGPHGWSSVLQSPSVYIDDHLWAGIYTVTITANGGCQSILSDTLQVFYPPVVSITYKEGAACAGSDLRLYGSGAGTYAWSGPNGWSSTERDPLIEDVTTAHSGTYTLTVTAANGCSATASVDITIHVPQPVTASPAVTHACEGNTVQLFAQGSGTFFQWSGPATYYSTQQNPVIHNIPIHLSGIYTVRMIDENGCASSDEAEVLVYDQISAKAVASPDTVCEGQSVQLYAEGGSSYLWNGPNGFFSTDPDPRIDNVTLQHEGTYYVYIYNEGGCFGYAEVRITVRPSARGFAYASPNPVNEGQNVQLFASDGVAYQWSGPNGWSSTAQNPIITRVSRAMAGVYIVTITNENGCPTVVRVVLKVSYKNNGGSFLTQDDGLQTRSEEKGTVYPNPTNDYLYFETPSTQSIEYTIYDVTGKMLSQGTAQDSYISTGQMPSGVYLIRWKPQDLQSWNQNTFVKIR